MISTLYTIDENPFPLEIKAAIKERIEHGLAIHGPRYFFFRADDIGVPSQNFERMMRLFLKYQTPLCLAVVPAWMTRQRWKAMEGFRNAGKDLFCWHMHGYRHRNHEKQGKKQEFGPGRSSQSLFHDLSRGKKRLDVIMGENLTPVFTPPWNRCSLETLNILMQIGFKGISGSHGSLPDPSHGLKAFPVHVDLHTRKEKQAKEGWQHLMEEVTTGMAAPACGIMIHHMCMNTQAFLFLEMLLELISGYGKITTVTYNDLI